MNAVRLLYRSSLVIGLAITLPTLPTIAQTATSKEPRPPAPGLRSLAGDEAQRAAELDQAIAAALKADRWDAAIARTEELLALRRRVQGPRHFETVNAEWRLKALHRVAPMPTEDRAAHQSVRTLNEQAEALHAQGKYAAAQPLVEKALAIRRRLLTDDHPDTAQSYNRLANNLKAQGKYAAAQPLFEQALAIRRRLLSDDHPDTAQSYNNVAHNLTEQGKYAAAQPLFEKALAIRRHLLADDHPDTAISYNTLAWNLGAQGQYAAAQPLYEQALEIFRRRLSDDHPDTAFGYSGLAQNLKAQGQFAAAQPLLEKALAIRRRRLGDDHPDTAQSYDDLAAILHPQRKHTAAQPLFEKALEIRRRRLGDDHPYTAASSNNLALNLNRQGKYAQAQPLYEKALENCRRRLGDDHPDTAAGSNNLAANLGVQGKYTQAQPLLERALAIYRRLLGDDHPLTANSYGNLAVNLNAQGKYLEARDQWLRAVRSLDAARLRIAFTGVERAGTVRSPRPVLARLGRPAQAWQALEEDLGRGLLDELAVRQDQRLTPGDRGRLRELTAELEQLDRLVETTPLGLGQAERAKRFNDLKRRRGLASIALSEFQARLVQDHHAPAGQVARLNEIQSALPTDAALVAWVDLPPASPRAADPDGEHWGVVVRARGVPAWIPVAGTGPDGLWTRDDTELAGRVRTGLRSRPGPGSTDLPPLVQRFRAQRLDPMAQALGGSADGLPPARRLIVLPSRAMAGIPVEALLGPDDSRTLSYAPSATVWKHLRQQPRPVRQAGLLALGDPISAHPDESSEPQPLPDHGLLVQVVAPGSNAATHGLKPGDVLLAYHGRTLKKQEDLQVVAAGDQPIAVDVWRDGRTSRRELAPGELGVVLDPRPAPEAIAANPALSKVLVAARGGSEDFPPLPSTRSEVEALAQLFQADHRPVRTLLGSDASEPTLDRLAVTGELGQFGFVHLATHGVIDEGIPARSAVILTQTGLPDPLEQALSHQPAFDGRLTVREIQRTWDLHAELVTLSACETALGRQAGGEGFVGFTQALLLSGARSVCLSLWRVDDAATALLMQRFYANLLGRRPGLTGPMGKAEALREAKAWLRSLRRAEALALTAELSGGVARGKGARRRQAVERAAAVPAGGADDRPYAPPYYWAAFVLAGDPD
jgi:tetratricopeptide (TPR) repeat protein